MYRKGKEKPISSPIKDTAAQRDFYSKPTDDGLPTLDDLITDYEQMMHVTVEELRSLNVGDAIDSMKIAEVITHLAVRSSYMRGLFEDTAISMAEAIEATIKDDKTILFPSHKVPSYIEKLILDELGKLRLMEFTPVNEQTISKLLYFAIREGADHFFSKAQDLVNNLIDELTNKSTQFSHRTQSSVLSESMAPAARIEQLAMLEWKIMASPNGCSILPDCTSIAYDGEEWASLIFVGGEKLHTVILPLTPERLAVGVKKGANPPDLTNFNQIAAQASHTFFLSSESGKELNDILPKLGGHVQNQVTSKIKDAVTYAVDEMLKVDPHINYKEQANHAVNQSWSTLENKEQTSFFVQLLDFGDEALATKISEVINHIIIAFSKYLLPTKDLSGFVFANDYQMALKSIERGFEAKNDLEPIETGNMLGVSMPLLVVEDDQFKTLIVARSFIAVDLISNDECKRTEAINIILHNLSYVALANLIQNKFPEQILASIADEYEGTLFQYTDGVFSLYFCATISCSTASTLSLYEKSTLESLRKLLETIPKQLQEYISHRNMEILFPVVAELIADFMNLTARLLGALKNQEADLNESSSLHQLLKENQLLSWFELFQKDLQSFDNGLETWAHFEEAFFVNRHFERIAIKFNIVPEPTDNQKTYIHVFGL